MKAIIQSFIIAAVATAITACTAEESLAPQADQPITVMATVPGEVWATASRALSDGYSDLTLHYTDYKGEETTYVVPSDNVTMTNNQISFTTGSDLVWERVDATNPIHLTCNYTANVAERVTFHTSVAQSSPGEALTFTDAMTPIQAKLTVKVTLSHNMGADATFQNMKAEVLAKPYSLAGYNPMTDGGVLPAETEPATQHIRLVPDGNVFTGSALLPQQTMEDELIIYFGTHTWTLDLSQVKVKDTNPVQYANQLIAGQHLTLNLKASVTNLNAPADVQIEAFTKADATDYEGDLGGAVNYFYDAATNTYTIWHENAIEACLADRAKNHPDAAVVSGISTLAVVSGAETDKEAIDNAIDDGKTTFIVVGESIDLVGSCIQNSKAAEGTINLILADAVEIETRAFENCTVLKSVNLPKVTMVETLAFYQCQKLKSVNLPNATSIGNSAFEYCTALKSVNLPNATWIRIAAFKRCQELTSVDLPNATSIEEQAFYECEKLTSVNFPKVTSIESGTFEFCSALTSVNFPEVTSIGDQAFMDCTALTSVNLPKATSIGYGAFWTCKNLTSLTFGTVITVVGENSFKDVPNGGCDLTLASGQKQSTDYPATEGSNSWAGYTWKSITIK